MSRTIVLLTAMALVVLASAAGVALAQDTATPPPTPQAVIPGQYIVMLKDGVSDPRAVAQEHAQRYGAQVLHTYQHAIKGYAAKIPSTQLERVRSDARVQFVSEDREVSAAAQTLPAGIDRIEADRSRARAGNGRGSVNVGVAVIDTGIDLTHPDLNAKNGVNCVTRNRIANDDDVLGHGTHVAGIIGAKDNAEGVVGVAPGATLYSVKVFGRNGFGMTSTVICGIDWVTANAKSLNIKVANMSLGGGGSDDGNCGNTNQDPEHKAICNSVNQGITYVVSAGNDAQDLATAVPAAYDEVLTVTAMNDFNGRPGGGAPDPCSASFGFPEEPDDTAASFSNFATVGSGDVSHTIAAPGLCVESTLPGGYGGLSGTSMASPHVAGTTALCISSGRCSGLTPSQIISKVRADAVAQSPGYGFTGDPYSPNGTRYYGNLVYAGGY
jgi:subtilisin